MNTLFRVSAISAYLAAYEFFSRNSNRTISEAKRDFSARSYRGAGLDWEAIEQLRKLIDVPLPRDRASAFRLCLATLIQKTQPSWAALVFGGRDVLLRTLDPDTLQCFEVAGIFTPIPGADVVEWLDQIAIPAMSIKARNNLAKGRAAERLSLKYEQNRLDKEGIKLAVEWVALNDNYAGFDVLSWMCQDGRVVPKLIEVKACSGNTLSFYITRHEWDIAQSAVSPYVFQIWELDHGNLTELSVSDVQKHIPVDRHGGTWQTANIRLG
jgi:hypothetical protein